MRYRRWKEPTDVDRRLEPYGLVLKAGRWYLIAAAAAGSPRTYRVDQILAARELDERASVPDDFDLAAYWQAATASFLDRLRRDEALVRLAPDAIGRLPDAARAAAEAAAADAAARAAAEDGGLDPDGWIRARLPIESVDHAFAEFLALGAAIEVLEPAGLRERIAREAAALAALYA